MRSSIITQLEEMLYNSDVESSEVSEQRQRNMRYFAMQPLGNERRGRSHYIDPTVLSSVENKKAIFSETFLSSRQVVSFTGGDGPNAANEAKAKTEYVSQIFKKNKYEELFRDAWHDAFVTKRCVVWTDWTTDTEIVEIRVQGAPTHVVNQQIQSAGDIVSVDSEGLQSFPIPSIGQQQYVHSGVLKVEIDASYISMELIAPEKFFRDPNATYIYDALWNSVEVSSSKGVLEDEGYDPDQVAKMQRDWTYSGSEEDAARKAHDDSYSGDYSTGTGEQTQVTYYKTRAWLSLDDDSIEGFTPDSNEMRLYEIHWTKGTVLSKVDGQDEQGASQYSPCVYEIDECGVFEWSELKISHAENGLCTADVEASTQKQLSMLKRGILDNMHQTNNSRLEAVRDRLLNPRDLLDNVTGGVVWSESIGSVAPLAQAPLSPMTMPAIEMISRDSDERSGMSSLARGMNSDVIRNQNADSMIERLTNAGTRRVTAAARDFAKTFLVPLMQHIVKLGMANDKSVTQMESGGDIIPIAPSQWMDDTHAMDIAVALTPDDASQMASQMVMIHQLKSQDQVIGPMYGPEQRHAFYDSLYELIGVDDATPFLMSPKSPEYQQAMQQQAQTAQQQQARQDEMNAIQAEAISQNVAQGWAKINSQILDDAHDNELDDKKFIHEVNNDNAELALEAKQNRGVSVG